MALEFMTENNDKRLRYLFQRYLINQINEEEYIELWKLLQQEDRKNALSDELQSLWENILHENPVISKKQWNEKVQQLISSSEMSENKAIAHRVLNRKVYKWIAAAAIIFLMITGGIYFYHKYSSPQKIATVKKPIGKGINKGILPGGNKAVLTLSNGSRIILDSMANGVITQQGKTNIIKSGNGQVAYSPANARPADVVYNMLSIPRGGKYQITLPDRTKVWLNSASTLRFPTSFPGDERVVEMTGEAYFEVAPSPLTTSPKGGGVVPFIVKVNGMKVKVLGTHFNIMAYDDEPLVKTTLLEGKVKVAGDRKQEAVLTPGEQAQVNKRGEIQLVKEVNLNKVIAWKNNLFWFEENNIHEVMRQVSRWYNADVVIKGNIPQHFTGSIPRDVNVLKVFNVLQETGNIHFKIEGHKIVITP